VKLSKLIGDLWNKRQSAANSFPFFAYSFVSHMPRQYYWRIPILLIGKARRNHKKSAYFPDWGCDFCAPFLPIGAARALGLPISAG
jgi:hypothetical protein